MDFEVDRSELRTTRVVDRPPAPLADGEIRLAVERFALTANNVTYAFSGDMLGYWGFFPTDEGWGRLPAMGLGTVVESANGAIATGGRYFGFYPMSDEVVIAAEGRDGGFRDVGLHRASHAPAYVQFADVTADPTFRDDQADEYLLLRGIFMTSFLVDDFLADNADFGAVQVLVTSASSKTAIALAHCLDQRGMASVGLTSPGNLEFVRGLGLYGTVISYDQIDGLDGTVPSTVVDIAGDRRVQQAVHERFADRLGYACQVGATHWEQAGGGRDPLPGPQPQFFFAPGQMQKRDADWGPGELEKRVGVAFGEFVAGSKDWLTVERSSGADAITTAYRTLVEGTAPAHVGYIRSMRPDAFADHPSR